MSPTYISTYDKGTLTERRMVHLFKLPDKTTFCVEVYDIGTSDSPIDISLDDQEAVRLTTNGLAWHMVRDILEMVNEKEDEELETHEPIVGLIASLHWACVAEPDAMGVI